MAKKRVEKKTPVKNAKNKVAKQEKERSESPQQAEPAPARSGKKPSKKATQVQVFSESFFKDLHDFQQLYRSFLESKNQFTDADIDTEMKDVTDRVNQKIQKQAEVIFKNQLTDLEDWIQKQINKVSEEIASIEQVYETNRESLSKTGMFSEDEVKKQLAPIQAKVSEKRDIKDKYADMLARSKQMHSNA